jgi:putative ABC transport system permease protein
MLKNYFKIAIRTLWKKKLFSFVNIFSLALGMAVGVLILARLKANYDADHFHPDRNRIVRILTKQTTGNNQSLWATAPQPLANSLNDAAFVEQTVQVRLGGNYNVQTGKGDIPVAIHFTEPSFFTVFGFTLLSGSAGSLANNPAAIFITEKTAKKIFGKTDVVGKTVRFENIGTYNIAGIIKDPLLQTHLPVEVICSLSAAETLEKKSVIDNLSQNWNDYKHTAVYARINAEKNIPLFNNALKNYSRITGETNLEFEAQPLEDITPWDRSIQNDENAGISYTGITFLLFLIFSVTILSAFNYISLSLARALSRAREIGVRKTMGAARWQIIKQFLMEAVIISLVALFFTAPLATILVTEIPVIRFDFKFDMPLVLTLTGYAMATGLIAGIVPSLILSRLQPVKVLQKMKNVKLFRSVGLYKGLIVTQFSVAVMLMVFFVILADYEKKHNATITAVIPANVITLDLKGENYENIKNEISGLANVNEVLATNWYYDAYKLGNCTVKTNDKAQKLKYVSIAPETITAEGIHLIAGGNFPVDMAKNTEQFVLLNEAAAKLLSSNAAGIVGANVLLDTSNVQVIGIMPNQLAGNNVPLVFRYLPKEITVLTIKINSGSEAAVIRNCKKVWKNYFPFKPADVYNLRDKYLNGPESEAVGFFGFFTLLVMLIAAMGILGIASYAVEIRTRELGIRKVLGAGKLKLIWVVTKSFGVLIAVAGMIGMPAGVFCGNFLRNRMGSNVDTGPVNVLIGFGLVAVAGLITVLSQAIRAGQVNPVKVLKAE